MLWLLWLAPWDLESGPSERQHLLGVGREDSEWGRRTTKGVLPEDIEVGASLQPVSLHSGHLHGGAVGSGAAQW